MAQRKICDTCGKLPALTHQYFVAREMDGAGSMDNYYGYIDLCHEHAMGLLHDLDDCTSASMSTKLTKLKLIEQMRRIKETN